ncbi:hypothetical protein BLL42_22290 [Pseudomonas frederiksbergensis]|uniref:Uncharacterized protein n=1 Tax=Pseudomonas frederiksbergensis TaxID=104087 RepID=A0A1J0EQN2_9PSED|nr:hypothetical protein BLL42_22290 [Pseudomonas frederiksbergensis]
MLHEAASSWKRGFVSPRDASEQDIHEFITAGFSDASVETRCNLGAPNHQIISLTILPLSWLGVSV